MWEAIRDNVRRSRLLIGLMGGLLVLLGFLIGASLGGPEAGGAGAVAALGIWLIMLLVALFGGGEIVLRTAGAREIRKEDAPQLWNVVEEMTIASGLGKMPRIFLIDDDLPNAFATGRKPETACVAVTSGLLRRLDRDELQGVVAHEIAHVRNLDIRFMTIASVMVGSIVILSDIFFRTMLFSGGRRSSRNNGQAQLIILAVTMVVAILAPIAANLLYLACSRKREYLADASAARFTRYPAGLASALEKISGGIASIGEGAARKRTPRALAPMYIVNPLQAAAKSSGWFSTHPPAERRIAILRAMGGNAGWVDYERAHREVVGGGESCLDKQTLASEQSIPARAATVQPPPMEQAAERGRKVADLLDRMADFLLISCLCGVRIKVPPDVNRESINCPRCGRDHQVPRAESATQESAGTGENPPLRYARQGDGWESFRCACDKVQQLSPAFEGDALTCSECGRTIELIGSPDGS